MKNYPMIDICFMVAIFIAMDGVVVFCVGVARCKPQHQLWFGKVCSSPTGWSFAGLVQVCPVPEAIL